MVTRKPHASVIAVARQTGLSEHMRDALSFWSVVLLGAAAIAAIAIATPVVLAVAAVTGLVAGKETQSTWRPVRA